MKRLVKIVEQEEYDKWLVEQNAQAWYENNVKGGAEDPFREMNAADALEMERKMRKKNLMEAINTAIAEEDPAKRMFNLDYVKYKTGSAELEEDSYTELNNVVEALTNFPKVKLELAGHTDNVGNPANNLSLSQRRAESVYNYLIETGGIAANRLTAKGYGITQPAASNDTEKGRRQNRRTEARITSK